MTYPHLNVHLDPPAEPARTNAPAAYQISPIR